MSLRAIVLLSVLIAGCQAIPTFRPYRMDIQQGNVVTQEMLARLQAGMTRSQVRFTLGTPLVVDPFRADRWDYVYQYSKRGEVTEQRRIVVVFKDDKLVRVEGDVAPAGSVGAGAEKRAPPAGGAQAAQQAER
jgi:outer membrane protein assembly factor BamE